jgi:hypothetical protein
MKRRRLENPDSSVPSKRYLIHTCWRGAKILPYVDDFLLLAATRELALALRHRVDLLFTSLGMLRHPIKGFWEPTLTGPHMCIDIATTKFYFVALDAKLQKLSKQARQLLQLSTRRRGCLPVKDPPSYRKGVAPLFLYPGRKILAPRVALRNGRQMGRPGPPHPRAPARHVEVDLST